MTYIDSAPTRTLDPLQSVLSHLPRGIYGGYESLCNLLFLDPTVPLDVKEGLRYLSAVQIGCQYCRTVREVDQDGRRLLSDAFYDLVATPDPPWHELVLAPWDGLFEVANEILLSGEAPPELTTKLRHDLSDAQIVEAVFFMLVIGASHRFSRAFQVAEACAAPTLLRPSSG